MSLATLIHSLNYGGILSGILFLFIVGSMVYNPELWLNDYPPDVRKMYGPPGEKTVRQRKWFGIGMLLIMIAVLLAGALTVPSASGSRATFMVTLRVVYIAFLIGSLMDLLVIDLLLGMVIRPKFMVLKGTEGATGYRNVKFHFDAFLRGAFSGAVLSLIITAVAQGILLLVG
jgi:hypothetical protein